MPVELSILISLMSSPCATREYSSPVSGSFRNRLPRSALSVSVVVSMMVQRISLRFLSPAIFCETESSSSDVRSFEFTVSSRFWSSVASVAAGAFLGMFCLQFVA